MKKYHYLWLGFFIYSPLSYAQKTGQICHVQNAPYRYAGLWEINTFGEFICNYWQFLGDEERYFIETHLNEYGEIIYDESEQTTDDNQDSILEENETETDEGTFIIITE
ncbi:hypothetical protein ACWIYZ_03160 [Ursidibacter arcticus]